MYLQTFLVNFIIVYFKIEILQEFIETYFQNNLERLTFKRTEMLLFHIT